MFHPFDIMLDDPRIEPEKREKVGQELMTPGNAAGDGFARRGEDKAAILFVFEQPIGIEPLHHVGDTGLGDFEPGGDIDDSGIALRINQLQDALEIVFNRD